MRLLLITNRNIVKNNVGESWFGEQVNEKGASELRLGWANKKRNGGWSVRLIREKRQDSPDDPPSKRALKEYFEELKKSGKACVFYIHGFNKSFEESLSQASYISEIYDVGVIAFSWPSYPGGWIVNDYDKAKAIASNSVVALDRTFEKFCSIRDQKPDIVRGLSINLLIHSLGNYMFEKFICAPIFSTETRVFDNIVLNAADVDLEGHEHWTNKLKYARRVYATINEEDTTLGWSQHINPERLGNTGRCLVSERLVYFDLSDGKSVGGYHEHFGDTATYNDVVKSFFTKVLRGKKGLPLARTKYEDSKNAYVLEEKEEKEEESDME